MPINLPRHMGTFLLAAAVMAGAGGCSSIKEHRGYIIDEALVQSVQPGIDNRRSVAETLGRPTFTSQFGEPVWYYVSNVNTRAPFSSPQIAAHSALAVYFDEAGNVARVERSGIDQVARIDPEGDETETVGSERSFLEDLFGNIGQVGAPGAPPPGGPQ